MIEYRSSIADRLILSPFNSHNRQTNNFFNTQQHGNSGLFLVHYLILPLQAPKSRHDKPLSWHRN
ncbi:MAG: hypothetical protein LBH80_05930 [Prevotellaceae bacterium]|nr:hypothetical protein [Prevotellaceae bacterium]